MATRKRTVPRRSLIELGPVIKDYLLNRSMRERSAYFEDTLKKQLMLTLDEVGTPEGANKKTLPLDEPLTFVEYKSGKPKEKVIVGIERRERVSNVLNHDKALAFLTKKGLLESCTTTVLVLNEDAVL